ncbi:hypothetical protein Rrhod_2952 [Rhodococcus rhodnii LMG 5362]|uniref:Uncharacterized protein n=1 Tax=Rhodococcus rhodnii LMG 5362 TaxID=1273125 RepID=R7WK53_9NOCA|nr:hypothetical protein Rrhod_2952 [Rhodococcus rhodnii LMG 5362]
MWTSRGPTRGPIGLACGILEVSPISAPIVHTLST